MRRSDAPRVAINAQILPGTAGGVGTAVMALVRDLGRLDDGAERYSVVVGSRAQRDWLAPYLGRNQDLVVKDPSAPERAAAERGLAARLKRLLGPALPAARKLQRLLSLPRQWPEVPVSDGFWESLGCDVLHIPTQNFTLCALPTVYNPHDLQHLHFPQFFEPSFLAWRETIYPMGCRLAHTVVVGSRWTKDDVVRQYGIHPDKVQVIPEGPPTAVDAEPGPELLDSVRTKYRLERPFALYPAVTWPHKNHLRLLDALAAVRDRHGVRVRLVCSGAPEPSFWPRVQARLDELALHDQVQFVGFVPQAELRAIYRLAQFLIQPTLFEASSLPAFEAWLEGVPVACSAVAALPEQVQDAALLFDPLSVEAIADVLLRMQRDEQLRARLRERGRARLLDFDCLRTARAYRAVYRRAAGVPLGDDDRELLEWDWMREPRRKREVIL